MNIVIRVDASLQIGSGHLMRCLTLAGQLSQMGAESIFFVSRELDGNMLSLISSKGYGLCVLPKHGEDGGLSGYAKWLTVSQELDAKETVAAIESLGRADWLIVDHYAIDYCWESIMRPFPYRIMAIDDLANRMHDVDILLDQNYPPGRETDYAGLVPESCSLLIGTDYLLLRDEFYKAKKDSAIKDGAIKRILVFFGGCDLTNETGKSLQALEEFPDVQVDVVVGGSNPHAAEIARQCKEHGNWNYHFQVDYIAELMEKADLSIGAGGTTTWERAYMGLPAIAISVAENQSGGAEYLASKDIFYYLGTAETITAGNIADAVHRFQIDTGLYRKIQAGMEKIFETHMPCRVAEIMMQKSEDVHERIIFS